MKPSARHLSRVRLTGFSLLEVILALTILTVLSGTIFFIVLSAIKATGEIEIVQRDNQKVRLFLDRFRAMMQQFPSHGNLELQVIERDPLLQELVIHGVDDFFVWGPNPTQQGRLTIAIRRREKTALLGEEPAKPNKDSDQPLEKEDDYYLAISRPTFAPSSQDGVLATPGAGLGPVPDDKDRYWLELIPKISALTWKFYDPGKKNWKDHQGPSRPPLVEVTITPYERPKPIRAVFAIP